MSTDDTADEGGPRWAATRSHPWRNEHLGNVEAWTVDNWLALLRDFRHRAEVRIFDAADLVEFVGAWARVEHDIEYRRVHGPALPEDSEQEKGDETQ